jgi:hypothetical protein
MPADGISLPEKRGDLGTSRWQLCGKATSLSQAHGRGPWQSWHEPADPKATLA